MILFESNAHLHWQKLIIHHISDSLHRVGIIGEPMAGFNPLTLVPFGEGHEDNGDENESRRE